MSPRIHTSGPAWHDPRGGTTAWQAERARGELLPMKREFVGARGVWSWLAAMVGSTIFWTAVFAWWLS